MKTIIEENDGLHIILITGMGNLSAMYNPCVDALCLNQTSQAIDDLVDEFQKKVRSIVDYEYKENSKKLCLCNRT